jgi:hypothetical protein
MGKLFYFIVLNRTRKIFSVTCPICDDTEYGHRVVELQKLYDINCYTVSINDDTRENLINYHKDDGLSLVELGNILEL